MKKSIQHIDLPMSACSYHCCSAAVWVDNGPQVQQPSKKFNMAFCTPGLQVESPIIVCKNCPSYGIVCMLFFLLLLWHFVHPAQPLNVLWASPVHKTPTNMHSEPCVAWPRATDVSMTNVRTRYIVALWPLNSFSLNSLVLHHDSFLQCCHGCL